MSSKKGIQDKTAPRADLAEVLAAKAQTLDENRPEAIAKRAVTGHRLHARRTAPEYRTLQLQHWRTHAHARRY